MKKYLFITYGLMVLTLLTSCGKDSEDSSASSKNNVSETSIEAVDIMQYFIDNNAPNVGKFVEYDENTDPKNLLGRPNQYTSMIEFEISTVSQYDQDRPSGGVIEVFNNNEDAIERQNYLQSIIEKMPAWDEYEYINDNVILRIDFDVTPSDEKIYEELLDKYMDSL